MTTCWKTRPSVGFLHTVGVVTLLAAGTYGAGRVEVPDPSIMLPLVPAAAQAGAPACIKPGTRLTYFGRTASIAGEYKRLVQDDNGKWVDRSTGKRYDEEDVPSAASEAFNVIQVGYGASGAASIAGLWIPPEALARLRPGQVIEANERVGMSVTVAEVKPGLVTLSEVGPLHRIDSTYDAKTGVLSALTQTQQIGLASMVHSLRLVGQD